MKLADGVTVHVGGRKFKGEMPDSFLPKDPDAKKIIVDKQAKKIKAQEKEKAAKKKADEAVAPDAEAKPAAGAKAD